MEPCLPAIGGVVASAAIWWAYLAAVADWAKGFLARIFFGWNAIVGSGSAVAGVGETGRAPSVLWQGSGVEVVAPSVLVQGEERESALVGQLLVAGGV